MPNTLLSPEDVYYWGQGTHYEAYRFMGAQKVAGGFRFTVWAPNAHYVSVVGDFNAWHPGRAPLNRLDAGLWSGIVPDAQYGQRYKFHLSAPNYRAEKSDPFALAMEAPSSTGDPILGMSAILTDLDAFTWTDDAWMKSRKGPSALTSAPQSIYEVHLGSWKRKSDGYSMSYREIAEPLADYVEEMGFTHVELLPVMEHPYYGSWGYQVSGFYAATFRYGSPTDLMYLINYLHTRGIGVLLDWVPAHFAMDPQALGFFDGSPLFEHSDPKMRTHPDWGTYVFDYGKAGVRNFLISNAIFWMDKFHIDGLRFDAVASMLYRDYSRSDWTPNRYGGRENLEAIDLLRSVNREVYARFPEAIMTAEESTSWPAVSKPIDQGGLGFLYKWNMGWMNDTLHYIESDPVYRGYHHNSLTFPLVYAFSENFTLPLSHDEVVHLKGSLFGKMPGDDWQKAANLRILFGHQVGHPGKKLVFMGGEFGQRAEWNHDAQLQWDLLNDPRHAGIHQWTKDLLHLYRSHPALWNDSATGFHWQDVDDRERSIASYRRMAGDRELLFVFNFTPVVRTNHRVGVRPGFQYREVLNSDHPRYGGSGVVNSREIEPYPVPYHGRLASLVLTLPPLSLTVYEAIAQEG